MEISSDSTVAVKQRLVSADLGEEVILLHLDNGLYFGLGNVGARIWQLLEKPVKVGEIERVLLEEYDVDPDTCHAEVVNLLNKLVEENLVEVTEP
jgi:hypothetical protein